ncbi:MAG TPA: hypothetical protein VNJ51_10550 [Candidatus Dormibacteraeota bacterium]|nr:hypothetical protein [Candidatus Dormibacteraeota bacterium]
MPDLPRRLGLILPELPRAVGVFGIALLFEVAAMLVRSHVGWQPLPLDRSPALLVIDALVASAIVEFLLRGAVQGLLPWFGLGALLSLAIPAALEFAGGYTESGVIWEVIFGAGFVFARAASGSIYPSVALRFVQYLLIPAFVAVHR